MDPVVAHYQSLHPERFTRLVRLSLVASDRPGPERLDLELVLASPDDEQLLLAFREVEDFKCDSISYPFFDNLTVTPTRDRGWEAPAYLVSSTGQGPLAFGCMAIEASRGVK